MDRLPDMNTFDFFEWLNQQVSSRQDSLDFYDSILNQEHSGSLEKYAKKYLCFRRYGEIIRRIFHRFIDLEDFNRKLVQSR